jgi:glycosyltransferase involved in cell wall biosynthesis
MKTLSVVLATFNEERNLASCIESLRDIADEIIIVDGSSTDRTVEIARKYKAKVKITTNKPNFHVNKQMAIDMATKDWVLQMDADEHVSDELKKEIRVVLDHGEKFSGYWMPRKNWFINRFLLKGGQYPDYTLRLYKRGKGRLPQKDVHEQAVVDGEVGYLKGALLHYPYRNFKHYLDKWNLYNNLFANQIKKEESKKNIFSKIFSGLDYLLIKPVYWFLLTFLRHKGFMDFWAGFVFSFFSALRFPFSYLKYLGGFKIGIFFILLISFLIRFYNFDSRWGLGGDDGRDAIIALEAIKRGELPLIGPFSSAGPFVFGPLYYWLIMFSYILFPFLISAPWVVTGLLGVITVGIFIYLGFLISGKRLAVLLGLLATFSPQLVIRSLMLGPHTFVSTCSALLLLFFILLWQKKKYIFAFLMGVSVGTAISMHYQSINLLIFFPAVFLIPTLKFVKRVISFGLMLIGFLITSFPLLYWDSFQKFANLRNLMDYFLIGQYRIYVPNNWKMYLFHGFPNYWSFLVGRFDALAIALLFLVAILFIYKAFIKRNIVKPLFALGIIFFLLFLVGRFYKGERSEGYLLYLSPFILIFSAWLIDNIFSLTHKAFKYIGIILLLFLLGFNLITISNAFRYISPVRSIYKDLDALSLKFPQSKFSFYDYKTLAYAQSMPISLIMSWNHMVEKNGISLGIKCHSIDCPTVNYPLASLVSGEPIYDLRGAEGLNNKKAWVNIDSDSVYDDLIGWSKKHELRSNFSISKFFSAVFRN